MENFGKIEYSVWIDKKSFATEICHKRVAAFFLFGGRLKFQYWGTHNQPFHLFSLALTAKSALVKLKQNSSPESFKLVHDI